MDVPLDIIVIICMLASVTFTIRYGIQSAWRSNDVGKMQFAKSFFLSSVLVLSVINFSFPDYPGRTAIRYVFFSLLALALIAQNIILHIQLKRAEITSQYGHRKDDLGRKAEDASEA
jgi:hypothetical protein